MRRAVEWTDIKTGALMAFAAAELALIFGVMPVGPFSFPALVLLSAVLPVGIIALSPFIETARQIPFIDPKMDKRYAGDCLITARDIAKYPHIELVIRLDKYLGGGVTATPYYEDIVAQIIMAARISTRKHRLFLGGCGLAGLVQIGLLWQIIWL